MKCTINGKEVEVKEGTSIIEAMNNDGQRIAHYCWHPGLSVAGVCRFCMVEIEGNPRLQIACNTMITEGMKINNTSEKVKDAVKWGLDFHLINHPLDCPICDQAGECGLQDQYMEYGKYDSEMAERKVKKRKVVDLGPQVVLDSERCILCSRCVRFTDEVTGTRELGIFNRGDRSEVGTFDDKPLNNNYSVNVVDICPVGALTSKDFRFKQRVWYLKDAETVCTGCSTGCNTKIYFNREGVFRIKPKFNADVNGHWMCDFGRDTYKIHNQDFRLLKGKKRSAQGWEELAAGQLAKDIGQYSNAQLKGASLVVTGQQTTEELEAMISTFKNEFASSKIYYWQNNPETFNSFDGLLIHGDKNPNTAGLMAVLQKHGIQTQMEDLLKELSSGNVQMLVVAAPENQFVFPDFKEKMQQFNKAKSLVVLTSGKSEVFETMTGNVSLIPLKTSIEKSGTFTNFKGITQKITKITTLVSEALTLTEVAALFTGKPMTLESSIPFVDLTMPKDHVMYESRKKNEFVYKRGQL